jgi:hypothetical protein
VKHIEQAVDLISVDVAEPLGDLFWYLTVTGLW